MATISQLVAREVLDSRGFPTVEAEIILQSSGQEFHGRALVPSGASTGDGEALELRDGDASRFLGKGVTQAVQNVREKIAPAMKGRDFSGQGLVDQLLLELDGSSNKSGLGANATLAVSMAFARANSLAQPTYRSIAEAFGGRGVTLPVPLMNIMNGGKHADNSLDIQELMIAPHGFDRFSDALRAGVEVFHHLKKILQSKGLATNVGDEGGFAPEFSGEGAHDQALESIMQAIEKAGYRLGDQVSLAIDAASSEFMDGDKYVFEGKPLTSEEQIEVYRNWMERYPIVSLEDGLGEHDWKGWQKMTEALGTRCQLVGDDLFVTNSEFLKQGIEQKAGNAILIKLNQIGTVTETLATMRLAMESDYRNVVSHRSGETEDTFIADLAVGTDAGQIKTGSASRTDRIAKYNQLLRIEEALGDQAIFLGARAFAHVN